MAARHCLMCDTDFDDESQLCICPHHIGQPAQVYASNPTVDTVDSLVVSDLEDLAYEYNVPLAYVYPDKES